MADHNVVRIIGSSPDGEVWSINPRFQQVGGPGTPALTDPEKLQTAANSIAALNSGNVFPSDIRTMLSSSLSVTAIRVEHVTAAGELGGAAEAVLATPAAGSGTATRPLQVACCVTLNQGAAYGRTGRGRLYFPAISGPTIASSNLRIPPTTRVTIAAAMLTWFKAVADAVQAADDWIEWDVRLVVHSKKLNTQRVVDNIAVGDVLDTQRRRRDSLRELRTLAVW